MEVEIVTKTTDFAPYRHDDRSRAILRIVGFVYIYIYIYIYTYTYTYTHTRARARLMTQEIYLRLFFGESHLFPKNNRVCSTFHIN
jgi:hypothetical protein